MIWVAICGVGVTILVNLALSFHWAGKMQQRLDDHKESVNRTLNRHEDNLDQLYNQGRSHESKDNDHFRDQSAHWAPQERSWLSMRFENMEKRFDKLERLIRKEED